MQLTLVFRGRSTAFLGYSKLGNTYANLPRSPIGVFGADVYIKRPADVPVQQILILGASFGANECFGDRLCYLILGPLRRHICWDYR